MKPTEPGLQASHDAEIARRTLRALAERRLSPTPENYAAVFYELSGEGDGSRNAPGVIKEMLRDLVRQARVTSQEAGQIVEAAQAHDWSAVRGATERALARRAGELGDSWPTTALTLLRQIDATHPQWTRARKLDAITRVIENAIDQPALAQERLARLIESWGPALAQLPGTALAPGAAAAGKAETNPRIVSPVQLAAEGPGVRASQPAVPPAAEALAATAPEPAIVPAAQAPGIHPGAPAAAAATSAQDWQQVASRCLRLLEQHRADSAPARAALRAAAALADRGEDRELDALGARLADGALALERDAAERQRVRAGLQRLVATLCDQLQALAPDETSMLRQLEPIRQLLAGAMHSSQILDAETKLAALFAQQAGVRRGLQDAKLALKEMLSTLIERIAAMSSSTERFHGQVGAYQSELESAERAPDYQTLTRVVRGLLTDTQAVRSEIDASRAELAQARHKVETYEARVRDLERELTQVATLVQKDPLTHALNRRGLEEAFRIETARAQRYASPLVLAMVDLDDFKALNDSLGHIAGDRALLHFVTMLQATLRPTEQAARTGGEEFAILLPATSVDDGREVVERLQREVAQRPFGYEGQKRILSFSAGVAQWRAGETLEQLSKRADAALYAAKRAGKNRVRTA